MQILQPPQWGEGMADIIHLPDNLISRDDRQALESFGAHSIALGRATRFHWAKDRHGNDIFEIYRGGALERLTVRINRDRERDIFCARDAVGHTLINGTLDHVLARLEYHLAELHDEHPPPSA